MTQRTTQQPTNKIKSDSQINSKRYSIKDSFSTYKYRARDIDSYLDGTYGSQGYVKKEEASDGKLSLTYKQYNSVIKDVFEEAWKDITQGKMVEIPYLGSIGFNRWKVKRKIVDFKQTRELYGEWNKNNPDDKKVVYVKNINTRGWGAMTRWRKPKSPRDLSLYKFVFVRKRKEELAKMLKKNPSNIYNYEIIT
jgi:hypothetical protein